MKNTPEKKVTAHSAGGPDAGKRKEIIAWLYNEMDKLTKELNQYNEVCDYYHATKAESMRDAYLCVLKKLQGE